MSVRSKNIIEVMWVNSVDAVDSPPKIAVLFDLSCFTLPDSSTARWAAAICNLPIQMGEACLGRAVTVPLVLVSVRVLMASKLDFHVPTDYFKCCVEYFCVGIIIARLEAKVQSVMPIAAR